MAQDETRPNVLSSYRPDNVLYSDDEAADKVLEEDLTERMIRRPTEEDFEDILTPEGNSGDIVGSDISDSTVIFDALTGPA